MKPQEQKRKAPAFQFYADDFLAGTSDMSAEEVGGYIRLLCHQWTKGGIPNDEERAGRMAGLMGSPSIRYVLAKFSPCEDGLLRNARLEQVRQEQADYKAKQATSGKAGAEKRWSKCQNDGDPNGVAIATPMATPMAKRWPEDSSPSPSPSPEDYSLKYKEDMGQRPRSRFVPPTREELDLEAAKIGLPSIEVDKFVNYYGANGWRVGKSPMKSWTHALAGWSARFRERSTTTQSNDPIARRNALLGDDIAAHSAEATRRSQEIDRAHDLRYEQTGKTPFDP